MSTTVTQYRAHTWLDTKKLQPIYGIQAFHNGKWMHCMEEGKPLLFTRERSRDAKLRKLQNP